MAKVIKDLFIFRIDPIIYNFNIMPGEFYMYLVYISNVNY